MLCIRGSISRLRPLPHVSPLSRLFATSKKEHTEGTTSKRKQFRQTPIDPRVFQHLERLGLGWVSRKRTRFPKKLPIPEDVDPKTVPYFQKGRFRQTKRALRHEKKRLEREAMNRARAGLLRASPASSKDEDDKEDRKKGPFAVRAKTRLAQVTRIEDIPPPIPKVPELAIIGRSNVGKSTLLNSVLGIRSSKKAAAVADRPGVTQSLDFYVLGPQDRPLLVVVDMPGYGFAFANDEKQEAWHKLMLHYLRHPRSALKRVLMLVDARHGFKLKDREFLEKLYSTSTTDDDENEEEEQEKEWVPPTRLRVPKLQVVLTKCDMVTREDLARRFLLMKQQLDEVLPRESRLPVMMVSASKGQGVAELRRDLAALIPAPLIQDLEHRNEALRAAGGRAPSPPPASTRPSSPSAPFKRLMADKPSVARSIIRKGQSPPPARASASSPPRRGSGPPFSPPRRGPSDKPPGAGRWEQRQQQRPMRGRSSSPPPRHRPSSSSKPGGAGRPDRRAASPKKTRK